MAEWNSGGVTPDCGDSCTMSKLLLLTGAWLASLAAVFYAGTLWNGSEIMTAGPRGRITGSPAQGTESSGIGGAVAPGRPQPPALTSLEVTLATQPWTAEEKTAFKEAVLASLRAQGNRSDRLARLARVIESMNKDNAVIIREAFGANWDEGCHFQAEHDQMWMRYGEVLGEEAADEFAKPEGPFHLVYARMVEAWAMSDPQAAQDWLVKLGPGPKRDEIANAIVRGMAAVDSTAALNFALGMPPANQWELLRAAEGGAGNIGGSPGARKFRDALAGLPPEQFKRVFTAVADQDPVQAVGWAEAFSAVHPALSQSAYTAIADSWAGRDVTSLSVWLDKIQNHPGGDAMTLEMIRGIVKDDPEAARAWAARIKDPALKQQAGKLTGTSK